MRVHRGVRPVGRGRLTAVIHLEALYVTALFIKFKCIDIALNREGSVKLQNFIILKKFLYISLHGRVWLLIRFFWVCQLRSSRKPSLKKLNKQLGLCTFILLISKC